MTDKSSKTEAASATAKAPKATKGEKATALLVRISEITDDKLQNMQITDKSELGIASKVARTLNKEAVHVCEAHRFWTGAHVLSFVLKNSR